jgi:hypothetical protein
MHDRAVSPRPDRRKMTVISTVMTREELTRLKDEALVEATKRATEVERRATTDLVALLIELERRGLHLALGYSSMLVLLHARVAHGSRRHTSASRRRGQRGGILRSWSCSLRAS